MQQDQFMHLFERQIDFCRQALEHNNIESVLGPKKEVAREFGISPVQALGEPFSKAEGHLVEMMRTGDPTEFTEEQWSDAVGDLVCAIMLVRALAQEDIDNTRITGEMIVSAPITSQPQYDSPPLIKDAVDYDAPPPGTEER